MRTKTTTRRGTKGAATRERILDAAAAEFRVNGFTGTRLADIAARASTQAGSMYYHFSSREELVREVLQIGQERTNDFVMKHVESLGDATSLERLHAATVAHLRAVLSISDYTAATLRILGQVPEEIRANTLRLQRTYGRFWRELFENAQDDGFLGSELDLRSAQMILLGAINATADWFRPDLQHGLTLPQLETQVLAVFFEGLTTPAGRKQRWHLPVTSAASSATAAPPEDESRGALTAARILDAAAKIFRAKGYAGTRLVDVATAANMQTGSMYYHFDSREDLVTNLLHGAWERTDQYVRRSVDELPSDVAPINAVATALTAHLLSVLGDSDYTSAMLRVLGQVPTEVRDQLQPLQREYLNLWRTLLGEAIKQGQVRSDLDLSVLVMLLTGSLNWVVEWYNPNEYPAPDKLAIQFGRVLFDGIPDGQRVPAHKPAKMLDSNLI